MTRVKARTPAFQVSDAEQPGRIDRCLAKARAELERVSETASLDAQILLSHTLGKPRAWLLAHPEYELSPTEKFSFDGSLSRLVQGTPLAYLLNHWEFYGLDFLVTPDVLIPRPETELLVDCALAWLKTHPGRRKAAEAGTGSGCIAISLAAHCGDLRVWAGDISRAALAVAGFNRSRHRVNGQIDLFQADLLGCLRGPVDLIVANLPYIPTRTLKGLAVSNQEPVLALDGGEDGLAVIRRLLADVPRLLAHGGLLLAEIEAGEGRAAESSAKDLISDSDVTVLRDLAGRDRLLRVEKRSPA